MKIWINTTKFQNRFNTSYPIARDVETVDDLKDVIRYDHVCATFKNDHRAKDDFATSDVCFMDCDNDDSDDPATWRTPEDVRRDFPDVRFFYVSSRHNMQIKHKGEGDKERSARPRYHYYFPIDPIDDMQAYTDLKISIQAKHTYFDPDALDAARFSYGVRDAAVDVGYVAGSRTIDDFMKEEVEKEKAREKSQDADPDDHHDQHAATAQSAGSGSKGQTVAPSRSGVMDWDDTIGSDRAFDLIPLLDYISPDEYFIWIGVGAALKAEGYSCSDWDAWSRGSTKYKSSGKDSCAAKWDKLPTDKTGAYITYWAKNGGWESKYKDVAKYTDADIKRLHTDGEAAKTEETQGDRVGRLSEFSESIKSDSTDADKGDPAGEETHVMTVEEYTKQESTEAFIDAFKGMIKASASTPPIPTGFDGLDEMLGGGFFEGLYTIGAISSLGKTTFALQICDQMAARGQDVIVFSLEMARSELMAKSISRMTFKYTRNYGIATKYAKTVRGITNGRQYAKYDDMDQKVIRESVENYRQTVSDHLWIFEGIGDIGVAQIRNIIERHKNITGRRPVVLIDYLQILSPYYDPDHPQRSFTDKQAVDKNVLELKRISRDFKIPIMAISSFNRDSYTAPVTMSAFKESGAVEYSSDVLIGLQYLGMEYKKSQRKDKTTGEYKTVYESDQDPARRGRIRELMDANDKKAKEGKNVDIQIKILKNRNGSRGFAPNMIYYPMFNYYAESGMNGTRTQDSTQDDDHSFFKTPTGKTY